MIVSIRTSADSLLVPSVEELDVVGAFGVLELPLELALLDDWREEYISGSLTKFWVTGGAIS